MKNKVLIVIAGIILVIFIGIGSYNWYLFFLNVSESYGNANPTSTEVAKIVFDDEGSNTYVNASKLKDDEVAEVKPYVFKIQNEKSATGRYNLLIEDIPSNLVNDGCDSTMLLKRDQLKYQLKLNNRVIKEGLLSSVKDNILDTRSIEANKVNNYELRVYIYEDAEDWTSKHFHYKVTLKEI